MFSKDYLIPLLEKFGIDRVSDYGDFLRFPCPFREWQHQEHGKGHGKQAFSLDITENNPKGYCWVCRDHSTLTEILYFLALLKKDPKLLTIAISVLLQVEETRALSIDSALAELRRRVEKDKQSNESLLKMNSWFETLPKVTSSKDASIYLEKRGYRPTELENLFSIRWDEADKRVIIPVWDMYSGQLLGTQGRTVIDAEPKVKNFLGSRSSESFITFKNHNLWNGIYCVILVEGPFDMFRLGTYLDSTGLRKYIIPLALAKAQISVEQIDILGKLFKPVFILLDNDEAGKRGSIGIERILKTKVPMVKSLVLPEGKKDPDELNEDELSIVLEKCLK